MVAPRLRRACESERYSPCAYDASKVDSLKPREYIHSGRLITLPPEVPLEPRYPQLGPSRDHLRAEGDARALAGCM